MDFTSIIGTAAGVISTVALLPEIIKVIQVKETKDLSFLWLSLIVIGDALWLCYGILLGSIPLAGSNLISMILSALLLSLKFKYK